MDKSVITGNAEIELKNISDNSIDLIYLDPPFYTQRKHLLINRNNTEAYEFDDTWDCLSEYLAMIKSCIIEFKRILKTTGSLFFHCDKNASHHIRVLLDEIFGEKNFQNEIIWYYKRWSNGKKGLLNSHQSIYFYSKTTEFKFNKIYGEYSSTTNVDQILQKRIRNEYNKTVYAKNNNGDILNNGEKKGVPMGDVWEIPFLNPKARERTGYPTQKPILLMEKIIELTTDPNYLVVDPFCGSGTTVVAAQLLGRRAIGIDISHDAIELTRQRLENPIRTSSRLLERGRESYVRTDLDQLECLKGLDYHPVQRNKGIDAILAEEWCGKPVCIRIQRSGETVQQAAVALRTAALRKGGSKLIVVVTEEHLGLFSIDSVSSHVTLVDATIAGIRKVLSRGDSHEAYRPQEDSFQQIVTS